jgi:SNF2 family DNA or RNA helicase
MSSEKENPLLPHQKRIIKRLSQEDQSGLVLMHGLGSGKTRSSIEAYKALGIPAEAILPASLKGNYLKEVKKWLGGYPSSLNITTQQKASRQGLDPKQFKDKLLIIDEAHRLRNEESNLYSAVRDLPAAKRVLLTGTPIYNHPGDIAKMVNIAAGKTILPDEKKEFEEKYLGVKKTDPPFWMKLLGVKPGEESIIKNPAKLKKILKKYVDYHAGQTEGFPEVTKETVHVPLSDKQENIYRALMKDLPWHVRMKVQMGLPPSKRELNNLVPFLTGARMISNTSSQFELDPKRAKSPKIDEAFKYLQSKLKQDDLYKAVIYSNYLQSGVDPYRQKLIEAKIPFGEFTGTMKDSIRNQMIKDYNENKLKALLISSAGAEGLDLKGTRLVQLMEPHFNNEKIKQVIGRAARYKSHEGLPKNKQKVKVQNYLSSLNPTFLDRLFGRNPQSTDEYLQNLADKKEQLNEQFLKLIKE